MGLQLARGGLTKTVFHLPGGAASLECATEPAWADGSGRAGIRLGRKSALAPEHLDRWRGEQMDKI